jgi:rubrerythrin
MVNKNLNLGKMGTGMYDFNADEIFEMAEKLETNGAAFYTEAAAQATDSTAKTLLEGLAAMEVDHQNTFAQFRAELTAKDRQALVFDPQGETAQYLKALADTRVFFEKKIDMTSLEAILKEAITAEKDSIVFYLGMKDMVADGSGKAKIDAIIKEEMGHIQQLSRELAALKK